MTIRARVSRVLLPVLALGLAVPALAGEPVVRVARARVYLDRADVTYVTRVEVPAGTTTVRVPGISLRAERDSLRVRARGVPAEIVSAALVDEAREPEDTPEYRAAKAEVERLEARAEELERALADLRLVRGFLGNVDPSDLAGKDGAGLAPERLGATASFLAKRLAALRAERGKLLAEHREVSRQLEVARARLDALGKEKPIRTLAAAVDLVARKAGTLTIEATVTLRGVSWRPAYRAVYDPAKGTVRLAGEGLVRQDTGLDWSDVELSLSTAPASRGIEPPRLRPPVLHVGETPTYRKGMREKTLMAAPQPAAPAEEMAGMDRAATRRTARATRAAWNVVYEVPGKVDVPADGKDHRFLLWERDLSVTRTWIVVPEKSRAAWLVAKGKVPADLPLLAGSARLFLGEDYAGATRIAALAPGAELTLPFGRDPRVEVDWKARVPKGSSEGFFGRKRQKVRAWTAKVTNHADETVRVRLLGAVPVSSDERIVVSVLDGTTPGYEKDRDREGILRWEFELAPGASREVSLEYAVRWPKDLRVWPEP